MADVVLSDRLARGRARATASRWSAPAPAAGTSAARWTGGPPRCSPRTGTTRRGTVAQQFGPDWFGEVDLVLAMDAAQPRRPRRRWRRRRGRAARCGCSATSTRGPRVPAPTTCPTPTTAATTASSDVLAMVERTADALVAALGAAGAVAGGRSTEMARLGGIAHRAETLLGTAVVATTPVAGGDICTATRLRLSNGTSALMKTRPHAPADFFRTEAAGLGWLAEAGGVALSRGARRRGRLPGDRLGGGRPAHRRGRRAASAGRWPPPHRSGVEPGSGPTTASTATSAPSRCRTGRRHVLAGVLRHPTGAALPQAGQRPRRHLVRRRGRRRAGGAPDRRPRRPRRAAGPAARRPVVGQPRVGPRTPRSG